MTKAQRKTYILEKLRTALSAILKDLKYDWTRESDAICDAASTLMEKAQEYIEGKASEEDIKPLYKAYVALHLKTT